MITDNMPPLRSSYIEVSYGPGPFDHADALLEENTGVTSRALATDLGVATNSILPTAEISIGIRPLNDYIPIILGWREVSWNGSSFSYTDQSSPLTTTPQTFPYDDTSTPTYTYRDQFKLWREL